MSSWSLYLSTEQNSFLSSADLSDNTVKNKFVLYGRRMKRRISYFLALSCSSQNRFHKKILVHQFIIELPESNRKHIRNFQDRKLLAYGFCMRQVIAIGNDSRSFLLEQMQRMVFFDNRPPQ